MSQNAETAAGRPSIVPAFRKMLVRLLVLPLLLFLGACGVNDLPTYDEAVKASWAQVENQYRRRADLIPNLVETVKAFAAHERETLLAVVEARKQVVENPPPDNLLDDPEALKAYQARQNQLGQALSRLLVVVERYPDLKSSENFLSLQAQLEGTENRIAVARRDHITAIQRYNTELRTYPGKIWAQLLYPELSARELPDEDDALAQVPKVDFGQ
jgi:LemA protein